ncbi:type VI secretion system membrane-associated complex protein TssK [Bacteroides sp. 224]|uniref:type VI secretion system membrane-associated complex protein TssK n=1 Tax=Bacteroides sp. 224 TaxID=2302936 RepID=UPI0013D09807|nr:type VI secretion system membrane-associated complex protein TssK [Bacteroides sp. 224]NDV64661.1 type VI secretion system membrane-associated complex protein TssK [Bacteroides sp. 224]
MAQNKLVNWTDSMDLHADLFKQTENYFLSAIAENAELNLTNNNYGLLPSKTEHGLYNGIRVNEHITGHIEVQLHNCKAVTASGYRIDFDAEEMGLPLIKRYSPSEDKNLKNRDIRHWDIILSVDPFNRTPTGNPDPEETPPRHPDCESSYALYIMPAGDINTLEFGKNYLTIGRLRKDGERYVVDTNYIPPSASMSAHPELVDYFNTFNSLFVSIEKSSKLIIEKIHSRSNKSDLATNIQGMCREVLRYIANIYFDLRNRARYAAPIESVNYISSLAHTCYIGLVFLDNRHKEEMLKYFYEWTDIAPGTFEEMIANTLDMIYRHDDLRSVMVQSEHFLRNFASLWERMSKLEYIGQHKESIVVSERTQEKETGKPTQSWSILD